ncbi:hypothetical protein [Micromonospora tarensis]|uniref:Uncharacterized protein n=1 Tax=Micromonospora tarensis TaxID=2806100 RepID=A0ABS1Y9Q8_9ACTN|nr:hypothetical protein [Micromonospora tarensis]MBM0274108.1 hypothetical protein [Micromonospora tarensis]
MGAIDRIDGGTNTARLSAAEQDKLYRAERQAKALKFLLDRGENEVAEILGLIPPTTPGPTRQPRRRIPGGSK